MDPLWTMRCREIPQEKMASELMGLATHGPCSPEDLCNSLAGRANLGTLFIDEVTSLPREVQLQLLHLIENQEVRPLGSTRYFPVRVRVVVATHHDLRSKVQQGLFREDLFYRLAVVHLFVPPLRERREDLALLMRHFLNQAGCGDVDLTREILKKVHSYPWPGNVRELRNFVQDCMCTVNRDLGGFPDGGHPPHLTVSSGRDRLSQEDLSLPFKEAKGKLVEAFERRYLCHILERHHGNISRASLEAGIDRNYVHRLIRKYGLAIPRDS